MPADSAAPRFNVAQTVLSKSLPAALHPPAAGGGVFNWRREPDDLTLWEVLVFTLYLLLGMLVAAFLDELCQHPGPHDGEEEQPTHCVPDDVIRKPD